MSRYRKGGGSGRNKRQQDRPASVHRQQWSGRLSHWYNRKPLVTVDQLHKYRRKEFATGTSALGSRPQQEPPIGLSAEPPAPLDTEYRCQFTPPYRTAEEMSTNRRHAAVPKDELQVGSGPGEFTTENAERYTDTPRERNVAPRQGSHIGPFVCADAATPEGLEFRSEQHDQYVPHPDGRRADNLRPGTGLRVDEGTMDGQTEQMAEYREYPTTPYPDAAGPDQNGAIAPDESSQLAPSRRLCDESLKEMILIRDSGILLRPAGSFTVIGGSRTERPGSVLRRPAFRLEVVDCSGSGGGGGGGGGDGRNSAFVVLEKNFHATTPTAVEEQQQIVGGGSDDAVSGSNRWVKRRQRKMSTARFFDNRQARFPAVDTGKTIQ
ncbi:uncharacterized protein LOC112680893 isoform X2 [Sipha flava]|uniref:Uncharacterized protein LOC112680893 isoform X2 n=1 Tax=Sipha flava TaxID=143950 RepID=A0A8B8F8E7_9HEMI|nr:uncharacterized protein LOC112680893 isoform X2 [Sipha flava]